jgi:hypothetical protein
MVLPNFYINNDGPISNAFISKGIFSFEDACNYIAQLPYGRNANKQNVLTVFDDNCATCSTKHALLKQLAIENNEGTISLIVGIFKMNAINTPKVANVLAMHQLNYLPEAHCYLKYDNQIFDFTTINADAKTFETDVLQEIEIQVKQIGEFKINYHQQFIAQWLDANKHLPYSTQQIWAIREQCIQRLSND